MNSFIFTLLCIVAVKAYVSVPDMIEITKENSDSFFGQGSDILVIFYNQKKRIDEIFTELNKAAVILKEVKPSHPVGYVDVDELPQVAADFRVRSLPAIRFIRDGYFCIYNQKNKARDYANFVRDKMGPVIHKVNTISELNSFKEQNDIVFAAFVMSDDNALLEMYKGVAFSYYNIPFVYVTSNFKSFGETVSSVVAYKKFDDKVARITGFIQLSDLATFIEDNSYPFVIDFRSKYHMKAVNVYDNLNIRVLLLADENDSLPPLMNVFSTLSQSYRGRAYFVYASPLHKKYFELFSVYPQDGPAMGILQIDQEGIHKYKYEGDFNIEPMKKFIDNFFDHKLSTFLKSEPLPMNQDTSVYKLVGKTFDFVALDEYKNVLVKFYIPNCEFCEAIEEKYKQVADVFSFRDDLLFTEINMKVNEVQQSTFKIPGYPTILLFPAGDKTPIEYKDRVDIEHVGLFLKKNTRKVSPPVYQHQEL